MKGASRLSLFQGFGIELEYMIVDQSTLEARPIAHQVLTKLAGKPCREYFEGPIAWSNELVMHVIELKANGPASDLLTLKEQFRNAIAKMNQLLGTFGAMLLPTAMHPFFDPDRETRVWDGEDAAIYGTYDRIFNCKGHGWSNLQSVHINLPFNGDGEFKKLHAAIRMVLPILPAIAQSSPFVQGIRGPYLDSRLHFYMQNQRRLPAIIGPIVPEPVYSFEAYQTKILMPMYEQIAPFDPEGELQDEWLNSRAAIARFSRSAIEIRLLDIGECLRADFAVIALAIGLVRELVNEQWVPLESLADFPSDRLRDILMCVVESGGDGVIEDLDYLAAFGESRPMSAAQLWLAVCRTMNQTNSLVKSLAPDISHLLEYGAVGKRIVATLPEVPTRGDLDKVYRQLAKCLADDQFF